MSKIDNVLNFYVLTTMLKDKIRSGTEIWHISKERLDSIAEHIYGTCMLAIAIDSEYNYNINIDKVIKMLAIHDLEEIIIGNLTPFDNITKEEKVEIGEKSVEKILQDLLKKDEYISLTKEFNKKESNEAKFATYCDKLELMLQMKLYEEQGYSNMYSEENKPLLSANWIKKLIAGGACKVSDLFIDYNRKSFGNDPVFNQLADYIKYNDINDTSISVVKKLTK